MSTTYKPRSITTFESTDFTSPTGSWPYTSEDMLRLDSSDDSNFYDSPRFVTHIDDGAIASLTNYYRYEFNNLLKKDKTNLDVLDICSSWISHLPKDVPYNNVVGIGMNEKELSANNQLTDYKVQDLNINPKLDFIEDNSFDVICNVVSVDYLIQPQSIFQEMHRVLRPGGVALISFSNRCFPSKAVNMWLNADDIGRLTIVASYFHYSENWKEIEALDILERKEVVRPSFMDVIKDPSRAFMYASDVIGGDPMFVVRATK